MWVGFLTRIAGCAVDLALCDLILIACAIIDATRDDGATPSWLGRAPVVVSRLCREPIVKFWTFVGLIILIALSCPSPLRLTPAVINMIPPEGFVGQEDDPYRQGTRPQGAI